MISRKQLVALVAFVLVGAFVIWLGREETPKNLERKQSTQTSSEAVPPATNPADSQVNPQDQSARSAEPQSQVQPRQTHAREPATNDSQTASSNSAAQDFEFPPGPSRELFLSKCTVCHSLRYISMQPDFSKTYWDKEVRKMINVYHARISDSEAKEIVDYLSAIKK